MALCHQGVLASAYGPRVLFYRHEQGVPGEALVAVVVVVVQRMVASEKAGVLFTVDPASGNEGHMVIEGAFGLGEVVVLGLVTPDRQVIEKASGRSRRPRPPAGKLRSDGGPGRGPRCARRGSIARPAHRCTAS